MAESQEVRMSLKKLAALVEGVYLEGYVQGAHHPPRQYPEERTPTRAAVLPRS